MFEHQPNAPGTANHLKRPWFLIGVFLKSQWLFMRIIENTKSVKENKIIMDEQINSHLANLLVDEKSNQQKILELCHIGKFLMFFDNKIRLDSLSEKPDFILNSDSGEIGLEHQVLINSKYKAREGFFENIFSIVESALQDDSELPDFLATCYLNEEIGVVRSQKSEFISIIKKVVKEYILTDVLIENPLIYKIRKTRNTRKSIYVNFGAWMEKDVPAKLILDAIRKKEKKLDSYRENSGNIQWLIIVIGSTKESSFNMSIDFELEFDTEFDKVFVLEDFYNKLYELK